MSDATLRVVITGDSSSASRAFKDTADAAAGAGSKIGDEFDKGTSRAGSALHGLSNIGASFGLPLLGGLDAIGNKFDSASDKSHSFAGKMSALGGATVIGAGAAIAGVGVESVRMAMNFDQATSQIAASANIPQAAAKKIGDAFLTTAGETTFSATTIAGAYAKVAGQLGDTEGHALSAAQALGFMKSSTDLAEASGTDLATSTSALAGIMQAYQIKAAGAAGASDTLFNAGRITGQGVDNVANTVEKLKSKLGDLAPSLGDTTGLMVDLTQHGETGRAALGAVSSGFENLLKSAPPAGSAAKDLTAQQDALTKANLTLSDAQARVNSAQAAYDAKPTVANQTSLTVAQNNVKAASLAVGDAQDKLQTAMASSGGKMSAAQQEAQHLGLTLYDASGKFVGMQSVIGQLQPKLEGMTQAQQRQAIQALFGAGASDKLLTTILAGPQAFDKATSAVDRHGAAHKAAQTATDNLKGQAEKLKATLEDEGVKIGNALIPKLEDLAHWSSEIVTWFEKHKLAAEALAGIIGGVLATSVAVFTYGKLADLAKGVKGIIGDAETLGKKLAGIFTGGSKSVGGLAGAGGAGGAGTTAGGEGLTVAADGLDTAATQLSEAAALWQDGAGRWRDAAGHFVSNADAEKAQMDAAAAEQQQAATALDGSATSLDGSATGLDGAGTALDGSSTALDGTSTALSGSATALDGSSTALDGTSTALDGSATALDGSSTALDGSGTALSGAATAEDGAATALDGSATALDGAGAALDGSAVAGDGAATAMGAEGAAGALGGAGAAGKLGEAGIAIGVGMAAFQITTQLLHDTIVGKWVSSAASAVANALGIGPAQAAQDAARATLGSGKNVAPGSLDFLKKVASGELSDARISAADAKAQLHTLGVPGYASGAIVPATQGGVLALLGEGGRDEAVLPLPDGWESSGLLAGAQQAAPAPSGSGNVQRAVHGIEVAGIRLEESAATTGHEFGDAAAALTSSATAESTSATALNSSASGLDNATTNLNVAGAALSSSATALSTAASDLTNASSTIGSALSVSSAASPLSSDATASLAADAAAAAAAATPAPDTTQTPWDLLGQLITAGQSADPGPTGPVTPDSAYDSPAPNPVNEIGPGEQSVQGSNFYVGYHLASGGIVSATPGGVLARIGEGGQDEAVLPLPSGWESTFSGGTNEPALTTGGGDTVLHVTLQTTLDGKIIATQLLPALRVASLRDGRRRLNGQVVQTG